MLISCAIDLANSITDDQSNASKILDTIASIEILLLDQKYDDANALLMSSKHIPKSKRPILRSFFDSYLEEHNLNWSNHGIRKIFSFWTEHEKTKYVATSIHIMQLLSHLSKYTCLGFGTVLGLRRDNMLLPNDDDIDILIAFPADNDDSYASMLNLIAKHLEPHGFKAYNYNKTHLTVAGCDIFVGFYESDQSISWYPSIPGKLKLSDIFPVSFIEAYRVHCPVPCDCEKYLVETYGTDWIYPDPNFDHPWDFSDYQKYA